MNSIRNKRKNGWLTPLKQLQLILKWHIGFLALEILGGTPSSLASFHPKRVLILGSGPSLDRVTHELLSNYDCIVSINFTIRHPIITEVDLKYHKFFWMTVDNNACAALASDLSQKTHFLPIFIPVSHHHIIKVIIHPLLRYRVIPIKIKFYSLFYLRMLFGFNFTNINIMNIEPKWIVKAWINYIQGNNNRFPPFCSHSGWAPIPIFAQLGAQVIHLIGVDQTSGLSASLRKVPDTKEWIPSEFWSDRTFFYQLRDELALLGVELTNLSWDPGPDDDADRPLPRSR